VIVVLYSPKYDELILVEKTELSEECQFHFQCSINFGRSISEYLACNPGADILRDFEDWVFVGNL
jgi:hypothetical protein